VGFNIASHSTLQEHKASKTAITLQNTKKNDNNQIIFNQQSMVRVAPTFDIDFDISPSVNLKRLYPQLSLPKRLHLKSSPHFKSIRK